MNATVGTVDPCCGQAAEVLFAEMISLDANYDDQLHYQWDAGVSYEPYYVHYYNSNSFVHGLIDASSGTTAVNFTKYVGGDTPVPVTEFE